MIQDLWITQYIDYNSMLATTFEILTIWAVSTKLKNKKPSTLFISILATSSLAFSVLTFNNYSANNVDYNLNPEKISNYITSDIDIAFSPKQGAANLIINTIQKAETSILVAAYSFTSKPITNALVNAHKNGVDVKIVLDKSQRTARYSTFLEIKKLGIPVRINSKYAIMHNKFMVIDGKILQTGSFNYSQAAENSNAENVLIISGNATVINQYTQKWLALWNESK